MPPSDPPVGPGQLMGTTLGEWGDRNGGSPAVSCLQQLKIAAHFLGTNHWGEWRPWLLAAAGMWPPARGRHRSQDTVRAFCCQRPVPGSPWPPAAPSAGRGERCPGRIRPPRERWLWNDTITPAEQAAREPSGMSCLSKAFSAPPRVPPGPQATALPGLTWAACRDPRRSGDGDGSSLEPTPSGDTRSERAPSLCWCVPPGQLGRGPGQLLPCGQSAVGLV